MSNKKENLKKSLGLTEYPWSSDDEDSPPSNPEVHSAPWRTPDLNSNQPGPSASASAAVFFSRKPPTQLERKLVYMSMLTNRVNGAGPSRPSTNSYVPSERRNNNHIENINHILAIRNLTSTSNNVNANPNNSCRVHPEHRSYRQMLIRPETFRMRVGRRFRNGAGAGAGVDSNGNNLMTPDAITMTSPRSQDSEEEQNSDEEAETNSNASLVFGSNVSPVIGTNSSHMIRSNTSISPVIESNTSPVNGSNNDRAADQTRDVNTLRDFTLGEVAADEPHENQEHNDAQANTSGDQVASTEVNQTARSPMLYQSPPSQGVKRKPEEQDDDVEPESVKEFNQRVLKLLECPVCLEWMEPPMCQCRRGHLVCSRCRARLSACPVCRTAFSSVRNRAMEGVAEVLRYPCRHGCGRDARLRRRAHHEASCDARLYRCPAQLCASRPPVPLSQLPQHFQSEHLAQLKLGARHSFSTKVNTEQHEDWLVMALRELFHLRVQVNVRAWGVSVYVAYIGPKCNAQKFLYSVTVKGQQNDRKLVYTRATHGDLENSSLNHDNVRHQDCFHLTLDQALNYLRFRNRHCEPDKYLDFEVAIEQRPSEQPQPEEVQPDS